MSGVQGANKVTGGNYLIYPIVIGIIKSSGFMFVKYLEVGIINGLKTGFRVKIILSTIILLSHLQLES